MNLVEAIFAHREPTRRLHVLRPRLGEDAPKEQAHEDSHFELGVAFLHVLAQDRQELVPPIPDLLLDVGDHLGVLQERRQLLGLQELRGGRT